MAGHKAESYGNMSIKDVNVTSGPLEIRNGVLYGNNNTAEVIPSVLALLVVLTKSPNKDLRRTQIACHMQNLCARGGSSKTATANSVQNSANDLRKALKRLGIEWMLVTTEGGYKWIVGNPPPC